MITEIALTLLMPTVSLPVAPARLPSPATPASIDRIVRLPSVELPSTIDNIVRLPSPAVSVPLAQAHIPGLVEKKAPSAIETLKKLVKDDRPIVIKAAFDRVTLPENDLENEIGTPVYAGR
jgi:hypothetical protein